MSESIEMNPFTKTCLLLLLGAFTGTARGDLAVVRDGEPTRVFAGAARQIAVVWQHTGDAAVTADVRMRLIQTSSATAVTIGEWPWKKLQVLPGQTVLEKASLDFPEVKAETRFVIKWLDGSSGTGVPPVRSSNGTEKDPAHGASPEQIRKMPVPLLGTTEVLVYPTNLLAELKTLAGEEQLLGVFDPDNVLKPLLKAVGIEFADLEDTGIADFRGKLAIIGPFATREQMPGDLTERIEKLARKGAGAVWLQPPPRPREKLQPSFRTVTIGEGTVIVAQPQLIANLADNPPAQLNLLHFCRLARVPEPSRLPNLNQQQ